MKRTALIFVFIMLVLVGALFVFTKKASTPAPQESSTNSTENTKTNTSTDVATNITYTDDGFSPAKLNAKVGDVIAVKNQSKTSLQFASDPHPVHTDNKELNQQDLPAGGSISFTVTKKGTFGYHDHNNSGMRGTIVVE